MMEEKDKVTQEEKGAECAGKCGERTDCGSCEENSAADGEEKCSKKDAKADKSDSGSKKQKAKIAELEKELEAEQKKSAEASDKYLRTLAEYDNFRRRSREERDALYADAVGDSVRERLPIFDNLKRAAQYDEGEKLAEGVKLILKNVPAVLEKLGVEEFGAPGEKFDPNIHNAVAHEESEEFGENEIAEVLQCGYRRGDKILRFAMVKVVN